MQAIATHCLTKVYRSDLKRAPITALDALDLEVAQNEVFGFLGRNGAGKTTTIKTLCGLLHPTSGDAFVMGQSIRSPESRRFIGYMPENPYFYEYLTPRETLDFYGQLQGLDKRVRAEEWEKLSGLLDLCDIADQRVRTFSKGMRQRMGFAVALVGDPQVLILDEPMSGLDPLGRRQIREIITKMRHAGKTIFFSSHVLSDVEQICDRVGIIVKGKLTVQGPIEQLLAGKAAQVEIIASGLTPGAVEKITERAGHAETSEAGLHLAVADIKTANEVVRMIHANGGVLKQFAPIRESLEEYFMRKQESP